MARTKKLKKGKIRKRNKGGTKRPSSTMEYSHRNGLVLNPERYGIVSRHTKKIKLDIENLTKMAREASEIASSLFLLGEFFEELAINEWSKAIWTSEHLSKSYHKNIESNAETFSREHNVYDECMKQIDACKYEAHELVSKSEKLQELTGTRKQGTLKAVFEEMKLTEIDFFDNVRSVVNSLRIVIALCEEKALLEGSGIHKLNIHGHVTNTPYAGRVLYKKIQTTSEILGKISAVVSENIILLGLIQFSETGNFQNNDE